jgi:DNA-binding NtrC family response regulator
MEGFLDDCLGRALVVDDLAEAREILGASLAEAGFMISYAADGMDAFSAFLRDQPDLIVTDWQMPRLNGLGLVRRVREISNVPVVMITAFGSIPDCEEALRVGADRYLQFRRDLDRLGEVARELVTIKTSTDRVAGGRRKSALCGMTAAEARSLAQQELREELQKQLIDCRGNIAEIARRMGRDRSTIRYHLQRMGMLQVEERRSASETRAKHLRKADD